MAFDANTNPALTPRWRRPEGNRAAGHRNVSQKRNQTVMQGQFALWPQALFSPRSKCRALAPIAWPCCDAAWFEPRSQSKTGPQSDPVLNDWSISLSPHKRGEVKAN